MRTYVNLEKKQVEEILSMFEDLDKLRGLRATEKFLRLIFLEALDSASRGM